MCPTRCRPRAVPLLALGAGLVLLLPQAARAQAPGNEVNPIGQNPQDPTGGFKGKRHHKHHRHHRGAFGAGLGQFADAANGADLLRRQASALRAYGATGDREQVTRYRQARETTWKGLSEALGID